LVLIRPAGPGVAMLSTCMTAIVAVDPLLVVSIDMLTPSRDPLEEAGL
jgi:hypothetical protein